MFLEILVVVILIEAITNILSKSTIFEPVRAFLFKKCKFFHDLLDCPYCTSVWVSIGCVFLFYLYSVNILPAVIIWFCIGIIFHRLSNIMHFIIDRIDSNHLGLDKENDI